MAPPKDAGGGAEQVQELEDLQEPKPDDVAVEVPGEDGGHENDSPTAGGGGEGTTDDPGGTNPNNKKKGSSKLGKLVPKLPRPRIPRPPGLAIMRRTIGGGSGDASVYIPPDERSRTWEMNFQIRDFENVTNKAMMFFFAISVRSTTAKRLPRVSLRPVFTAMFSLDKGQAADLEEPLIVIENKRFKLAYAELHKHQLQIDLWKVNNWQFNEYFGTISRTLYECATRSMNQDFMLKKKMSKQEILEKKKPYDVARFSCSINIEEVFDFQMSFDNWTFKCDETLPEYKKYSEESRNKLTFAVPKSRHGQAERQKICTIKTTMWNEEKGKFFWAKPGVFTFTGTRTHLQNQYFVVSSSTGNPPEWIDSGSFPGTVVGRALFGLTSVLEISVFKARVKALTTDRTRFRVGELVGNIKVQELSQGMKQPETDVKERPEQPKGSGMVSHLSSKEQYLVVRISKCENLPVADFDAGTSDPYLRVAWDGMVQFSPILKRTCRPVFNFTLFFPVRLVFPAMRAVKKYKQTALKLELESKGPVNIQVWDDDETSSDYLGGYSLDIADILLTKNRQLRALTGPVKPVEVDPDDDFAKPKSYQWFEKEETVRTFDGAKTELKGSSLPNAGGGPPLVHFEAYFWPDWEHDVKIDEIMDSDLNDEVWKQLQREWDDKNEFFRQTYAGPFADSLGARPGKYNPHNPEGGCRRFPCTAIHPQTRGTIPIPAFLCPIIIPQELCRPATLLHWINCLPYYYASKQERTGLMPDDSMKNASFILAQRKGPAQDHAVLLCCILLGCKKNAWVCKGQLMTEEGKIVEHSWVATLEKDKSVIFWEPSQARRYAMPRRWDGGKGKRLGLGKMIFEEMEDSDWLNQHSKLVQKRLAYIKKNKKERRRACDSLLEKIERARGSPTVFIELVVQWLELPLELFPKNAQPDLIQEIMTDVGIVKEIVPGSPEGTLPVWIFASRLNMDLELIDAEEDEDDKERKNFNPMWDSEVDDMRLTAETLEIQTVGRAPRAKMKAKAEGGAGGGKQKGLGRDELKKIMMAKASSMVFFPDLELLVENETLVTELPYVTLEVMFNTTNVYANRQNQHPACISYNMDEPLQWEPFLTPGLFSTAKNVEKYAIPFVDIDVVVPPPIKMPIADSMTVDILSEMKENMRLFRAKKGLDCYFDDRPQVLDALSFFADLLEERMTLDVFFCPEKLREQCQIRYDWTFTPLEDPSCDKKKEVKDWEDWYNRYSNFLQSMEDFPVKKGKKFRAYSIHFSTADIEQIRNYLSDSAEYRAMVDWPDDQIYYTVQCRVVPLLGGILSVWFVLGTQTPHDRPFFD
ncbi:unnamed protein product [Amoebophrya sp. A120]|nr:unnamed protein product [Amoebophrya sp. A120]|eukprot:GSA120T00005970001.1